MTDKYQWIGRKIRRVHSPVGDEPIGTVMAERIRPCLCGYQICSKTGPCAPKPVDALPEGWSRGVGDAYEHVSGAGVIKSTVFDDWYWQGPDRKVNPAAAKPTRAEAMKAALEAAKPKPIIGIDYGHGGDKATLIHGRYVDGKLKIDKVETLAAEPALRPGWHAYFSGWINDFVKLAVCEDTRGSFFIVDKNGRTEEGLATLEAALIRAEQLAADRGAL